LGLFERDGITPIDSLTYPEIPTDMTWGRYPDGNDDWGLRDPTAGGQNVSVNDEAVDPSFPQEFSLTPNFPNPFNPVTRINFGIPRAAHVQLKVYNICGREIAVLKDGPMKPGYHDVTFRGDGFSSGIYFFRMEADDFVATKKMLLLK